MNNVESKLLKEIAGNDYENKTAYNVRKNGETFARKGTDNIIISSKKDGTGLDITVKDNTMFGIINIPVIISESGLKETVYNDFYIGRNANVVIIAGCAIHNDKSKDSSHIGIHRFYLAENSKVNYSEKHYGEGSGKGQKILDPTTEIFLKTNSSMTMDTIQIKGVDSTNRKTTANIGENATLLVTEKIMTHNNQKAKTEFYVMLEGENSSTHIVSRSVAVDNSNQEFVSSVIGKNKCYAHVECDGIIKDNGTIKASPIVDARYVEANLIHEAAIGKIAGEQLIKLMSLGLTKEKAEAEIINGFLK